MDRKKGGAARLGIECPEGRFLPSAPVVIDFPQPEVSEAQQARTQLVNYGPGSSETGAASSVSGPDDEYGTVRLRPDLELTARDALLLGAHEREPAAHAVYRSEEAREELTHLRSFGVAPSLGAELLGSLQEHVVAENPAPRLAHNNLLC